MNILVENGVENLKLSCALTKEQHYSFIITTIEYCHMLVSKNMC
jgi:hypothetical protein